MIEINLFEMLAAAEHDETDAEKIAFEKIPGPPIPGIGKRAETMLDRVAKAIEAELLKHGDVDCGGGCYSQLFNSKDVARAAIAAMRKPTLAMIEAGNKSDILDWSLEPGEGLDGINTDVAWEAMIDAILSETDVAANPAQPPVAPPKDE